MIFGSILERDKNHAIKKLIEQSSPRRDFFVMIVLSVSMATFGFLMDSSIVLIGSMLIAPMLYSVLSLSLALVTFDQKLLKRSLYVFIKSIILSLIFSTLIGYLFIETTQAGNILEILFVDKLLFHSFVVSIIAGLAASISLIQPKLSESLPGVAISVSLIPPLAAMGISLAKSHWEIFFNAMKFFGVNNLGIIVSSALILLILHFNTKQNITKEVVKSENKALKIEQEKENGNRRKKKSRPKKVPMVKKLTKLIQ